MRTRAALLLCLAPALAAAQTAGSINITESSDTANGGVNDRVVNIAECLGYNDRTGATLDADTLALAWTLTAVPVATTFYKVYATTQACPTPSTTPATGIVDLTNGFQATNGSQTGSWPLSGAIDIYVEILLPLGLGGCTATSNVNLCVTVYDAGQSTVQDVKASAVLKVDHDVPAAPIDVSVSPGDSALNVSWAAGAGGAAAASSFTATATSGAGAAESCTVTGGGSTSCRIDGLVNGEVYNVVVVAFSDSENPSAESEAVPGVPESVDDFWRLYRAAGGREPGGCAGGAAGAPALLALLALARRRR
ncbi:MAG TPA: hypothetical protein VH880_03970 [Anaeromyxobacteraceae bacterium]|jgi:hypothetical protein